MVICYKFQGGDFVLCNRMKQFREYNGLAIENLAQVLGISPDKYIALEEGKETPNIELIEKMAFCYKVTVNEFYGYTPHLAVYDSSMQDPTDEVDDKLLKMSNLSWDEAQLILYYRNLENKEDLINQILNKMKEQE